MKMSDFGYNAINSVEDFNNLDNKECVNGYLLGLRGVSPEYNQTRSYYHGYLNGLVDGGFKARNLEQIRLVEMLKSKTDFIEKHKALLQLFLNEINDESKIMIH